MSFWHPVRSVACCRTEHLHCTREKTLMLNTDVRSALGADQSEQECLRALAALMVHVDMDRGSDQTVDIVVELAERLQAALIGVAGCALWPALMAGDVRLTNANQYDFQSASSARARHRRRAAASPRHRGVEGYA
jgi:hypothetical protein